MRATCGFSAPPAASSRACGSSAIVERTALGPRHNRFCDEALLIGGCGGNRCPDCSPAQSPPGHPPRAAASDWLPRCDGRSWPRLTARARGTAAPRPRAVRSAGSTPDLSLARSSPTYAPMASSDRARTCSASRAVTSAQNAPVMSSRRSARAATIPRQRPLVPRGRRAPTRRAIRLNRMNNSISGASENCPECPEYTTCRS